MKDITKIINKNWVRILLCLVPLGIIIWLYTQFTMNFGVLGIVFIIVILLVSIPYCSVYHARGKVGQYHLEGYIGAVVGAFALVFLGWLSIYTLNNYFHADSDVYRNSDHHAIRIDGINIQEPEGFVLAANSEHAFFDNEETIGQAVISAVGTDAVTLRLDGFKRALYWDDYKGGKCEHRILANATSLPQMKEGERLQMQMRDHSVYEFYVEVINEDSVHYHLVTPNGLDIISDEHTFIEKGLPLTTLTKGSNVPEADFTGLHLIRDTIFTQVKKRNRLKTYQYTHLCLEVQRLDKDSRNNSVVQIRNSSEGAWHDLTEQVADTIRLPFGTVFHFGYDNNATQQMFFSVDRERTGSGKLAILYKQPLYHYMAQTPEKNYSSVSIRTSFPTNIGNLANLPENILLFDEFSHGSNVNSMTPITVSFIGGETDRQMQFKYTVQGQHQRTALAGDYFLNTSAQGNTNVEWMVSVEDLKATSPIQAQNIVIYVFCFACLLAMLLLFGSVNSMKNPRYARRNMFTTVEFVAYAVTLYLVTFRWFLLWRTSVFLPVEGVSYYHFNGMFRNTQNSYALLVAMALMIIFLFFFKWWLFTRKTLKPEEETHNQKQTLNFIRKFALLGFTPLVLYPLVYVLVKIPFIGTWLGITYPVVVYLFCSVLIDRKLPRSSEISKDDRKYGMSGKPVTWKSLPLKILGAHLLNAMAATATFLFIVKDSGYGILFFTFALFWMLWKLNEHVAYFLHPSRQKIRLWILLVLFLFVGFLFCNYKHIIHFVEKSSFMMAATTSVGVLVACAVMYILYYHPCSEWRLSFRKKSMLKLRIGKLGKYVILSLLTGVMFCVLGMAFRAYLVEGGKHTAQRIAVHYSTPDEAMQRIKTDDMEKRYMQAALNHMIIGEYTDRGDDVSLIGENGHGYFKMQPHSRVGALWNAQLTDISIARFVIAEHSQKLPLVMVTFFLLMLLSAVVMPVWHRWARSLLIQIPLLLFIHALLIWMATTQRFIFLGQDFPMVSINSRLTVIYYFGLILTWIAVAAYEHVNFHRVYLNRKEQLQKEGKDTDYWRFLWAKTDTVRWTVALVVCLVGGYLADRGKQTLDEHGEKTHSFALTNAMRTFSEDIVNRINPKLLAYQDSVSIPIQRDMSAIMAEFNRQGHIDSLFSNPFGQRLWKSYVESESRNNNTGLVLYAHLNRQKKIELKTNNYFYNRSLPTPINDQWRGSLVAVGDTVNAWRLDSRATRGLTAYRLPGEWMADGKERSLVSCVGSRVTTPTSDITMRRGITSAVLIDEHSHIDHTHDADLQRVVSRPQYFARNVMVNGNRMFFFPQQTSLFWVKNLAEELADQKNKVKPELRMADHNANVAITLSEHLTQAIYQRLAEIHSPSAVVIANGDGDVLALVSRDDKYSLDPNDRHRLRKLRDSLEINGLVGSEVERRLYSNLNLTHIQRGPGSSQKPLVWTAVATQLDLDWKNLQIETYGNPSKIEDDGSTGTHFIIQEFNTGKFLERHPFKPLKSPDEQNGSTLSLHDYMTYSSNVYNAVMAYIGSFPYDVLSTSGFTDISATHNEQTLFAAISQQEARQTQTFRHRFPVLRRERNLFTLNRKLQSNEQPRCLLETSLHDMFFRNDTIDEFIGTNVDYASPLGNLLYAKDIGNHYAYVEKSYLANRQGNNESLLLENAIRSTAIGAQQVWEVTPWKMAESFGRMASLNSSFYLSVLKRRPISYTLFPNLSSGYCDARPQQMKGLSDVLTLGTAGGQMKTGGKMGITTAPDEHSNMYGGYYLYAKTGTISENNGESDRHRLGVIIANRDLAQTEIKDLEHMRYVVVYFTMTTGAQWQIYADVIRLIMESTEFSNYMNNL